MSAGQYLRVEKILCKLDTNWIITCDFGDWTVSEAILENPSRHLSVPLGI